MSPSCLVRIQTGTAVGTWDTLILHRNQFTLFYKLVHLAPCTLHWTLLLTPCTLHLAPCTLHLALLLSVDKTHELALSTSGEASSAVQVTKG